MTSDLPGPPWADRALRLLKPDKTPVGYMFVVPSVLSSRKEERNGGWWDRLIHRSHWTMPQEIIDWEIVLAPEPPAEVPTLQELPESAYLEGTESDSVGAELLDRGVWKLDGEELSIHFLSSDEDALVLKRLFELG